MEIVKNLCALGLSVPYWAYAVARDILRDPDAHPQSDAEGPERVLFAPVRKDGVAYSPAAARTLTTADKLAFSVRVVSLKDKDRPIENATVELWQVGPAGWYDNFTYNWRGKFVTNADGDVLIQTVLPGPLVFPGITRISNALRRLFGWDEGVEVRRPAHIHFLVWAPGYETLATQLYFDKNLSAMELAFMPKRVAEVLMKRRATTLNVQAAKAQDGSWTADYTFMLAPRRR